MKQYFPVDYLAAEIVVSEKEISDVKVGQPVLLKFRAFPQNRFQGIVSSIATAAVNGVSTKMGTTIGVVPEEGASRDCSDDDTIRERVFAI